MTASQVTNVLGSNWKKSNHQMIGHYTLVYPDLAIRIREGHVYEVQSSSSGWIELMKDVPEGGEYP